MYKKELVKFLSDISSPDFDYVCNYFGVTPETKKMLTLRYRSEHSYTREYIAEELGLSPSTLDIHCKAFLSRLDISIVKLCTLLSLQDLLSTLLEFN